MRKKYYGYAEENIPALLRVGTDVFNDIIRTRFLVISGGFVVTVLAIRVALSVAGSGAYLQEPVDTVIGILKALYLIFSLYTFIFSIRLNDSGFIKREIGNLPWVLTRIPGYLVILNLEEIEKYSQCHCRREIIRLNRDSRKRLRMRFKGDSSQFARDVMDWLRKNRFWGGAPVFEQAVDQMQEDVTRCGEIEKLYKMGFSFFGTIKIRKEKRKGTAAWNARKTSSADNNQKG